MSGFYDLTPAEKDIMEILWNNENPMFFKEVMIYVNEEMNKNWKKQTVNTYLSHLQQYGLVTVDKKSERYCLYLPTCSREEYKQKCVRNLVEKSFDDSIANFVAAFTGGKKLTKEEADKLKKLI